MHSLEISMPLAKELEHLLGVMGQLGILEPFTGCSANDIRTRMKVLEDAKSGVGTNVYSETDQYIKQAEHDIPIRIYKPSAAANLPVILYFHGGGFVFGSLNSHGDVCKELCQRTDAIVVSVDYRLTPEHPFPAAVNDAFAAVHWVASNAGTFGGDSDRIAVAGDSAGANLAAVTAIRCRDENGPKLRFQLLAYPCTHVGGSYPSRAENAVGYFLTAEGLAWLYGHYLPNSADGENWWVSPMLSPSLTDLPPALIVTAEFDPLRDEGEAYAKRLLEAGTAVICQRYDGAIHGFFGAATEIGERAIQQAAEQLIAALQDINRAGFQGDTVKENVEL
jgi:acetyl esterase